MSRVEPVPVVLFAYARPVHLAKVLSCLRENEVPLIYAFSDGAKRSEDAERVNAVRAQLRAIDWADRRLVEREENFGLGRNVLSGITTVAARHDSFIVWEDDLVCVPGTYRWLSMALRHYADDGRVMSVTAWTHPRVTPTDIGTSPYFDARAECWVWGTWARAWCGMNDATALEKLAAATDRGIVPDAYGADLPQMARAERRKNIWAVRWLYHHFAARGLCLRPPWSMIEHIGFDDAATHAGDAREWANPPLRGCPPCPDVWPTPVEHPSCRAFWQSTSPAQSWLAIGRAHLRRWGRRCFR